jgi:CBS domain-containing protein
MNVLEIMTRAPACCSTDTPLQEVARMMVDNNCGLIPVLDASGLPCGVISDRDIVCRTLAVDQDPFDLTVKEVMTPECIAVHQDCTIENVLDVLEDNQIRRAIVVDDDSHVVGIISQADLARRSEILAGELVAAVSKPSVGPSSVS